MAFDKELASITPEEPGFVSCQLGETKLLLEAFEMFTLASSSLESAFGQLQRKVQRLTEELESKNVELEKSLHEKEEAQNYLRNILERLPCGVIVLDGNGDVTLCNPMAADVLGKSKSSKWKQPDPLALSSGMRKHFAGAVGGEEREIPLVNGGKKRILATSGAPLTEVTGRRSGTLHIIRDITEMKSLQEQSKRVERLSAMGEMAVELAHEIRNPLGSVELFASLLVKELSGDPKRWAENIRVGIRSLNNIVSNMLHFANPFSPSFSDVNIHEVIEETLKFTDPIMNQRQIRIERLFDAKDPVIMADRELIRQMMLNLILNALKAMPANGSLIFRTSNLVQKRLRKAGLEIQIEDTGIGIPAEHLNRIFDPFFTTNKNGTGLGLSVVHQIVERHSGSIRVASEVNRGTVFTVLFKNDHNGSDLISKDSINE
jgi:two-component system, sensor histidine kinase FlrB